MFNPRTRFDCPTAKDEVRAKWAGYKCGYWTVLDEPIKRINNEAGTVHLYCQCVCGEKRYVNIYSISQGRSLSCGCRTGNGGKVTARKED